MKTDNSGNYFQPPQYNTPSLVGGYVSALKSHYHSLNLEIDEDNQKLLSEYLIDYKRKVAELKEPGDMKIGEGKQPMSFRGYEYLAGTAMKATNSFSSSIKNHTFLLLSWCLMARSISVSSIVYDRISWEGDALLIQYGKLKNDQEGSNQFPRRIYANPLNPLICPVLSLAIFVFVNCFSREGKSRLLFGETYQNNFSEWLTNVCRSNTDAIEAMGLIIEDIGTHSFRKGVATTLSNQPSGPSAFAIWLRAGWKLGAVQSRYIFQGEGGDQFVGRVASGLDVNDYYFSALPPHFNDNDGPALSINDWNIILPGYNDFYPNSFKVALPFLLASLVYHAEFLKQVLSPNHPLFQQRVWKDGYIQQLKSKVFSGYQRNVTTGLIATGIPTHVTLCQRLKDVESKIESIEVSLGDKIFQVPEMVKSEILKTFEIEGALPITTTDLSNMIQGLEERLTNKLKSFIIQTPNQIQEQQQQQDQQDVTTNSQQWVWGGRFHPIPEDFVLPKCNLKTFWDLWFEGNPLLRISPYKSFKKYDFSSRKNYVSYSKGKNVIQKLHELSGKNEQEINELNKIERDSLFISTFQQFCVKYHPEVTNDKVDGLSYVTWYERMQQRNRKRKRIDNDQDSIHDEEIVIN